MTAIDTDRRSSSDSNSRLQHERCQQASSVYSFVPLALRRTSCRKALHSQRRSFANCLHRCIRSSDRPFSSADGENRTLNVPLKRRALCLIELRRRSLMRTPISFDTAFDPLSFRLPCQQSRSSFAPIRASSMARMPTFHLDAADSVAHAHDKSHKLSVQIP